MTSFDVFLSHNSKDKPWVIRLKNELLQRGLTVWLDHDEIRPGDLFVEALERGIRESKSVVLVVSPEAMQSGWVREEYSRALVLAQSTDDPLQLIPVVLRDAELPGFLANRNSVDFRNDGSFSESLDQLQFGITGIKVDLKLSASNMSESDKPRVARDRVKQLDGWIAERIDRVRKAFEELPTVLERRVHLSLPANINGTQIEVPSPTDLIDVLRQERFCLLLVGEGGAGKTSLAFQIARWCLDGHLMGHAMLPVLIDQNLGGKYTLVNAVCRELRELIAEADELDEGFVVELLRHRRLLVIVDHFSEMDQITQTEIEDSDSAVNALLITSRDRNVLSRRRRKCLVEPRSIDREMLFDFMHKYLTDRGKRSLFKDAAFAEARKKLEAIVADHAITPLLAKLYLDQQVHALEHHLTIAEATNLPDLMQDYLDVLNSNQHTGRAADPNLPKIAKLLAWQCLREGFRPWYISRQQAEQVLQDAGEDAKWVDLLERRLRVLVSRAPAYDQLRFNLEPLADYLAALKITEECGGNHDQWDEFLSRAEQKATTMVDCPSFFKALYACYEAKGHELQIPGTIGRRLEKLAGSLLEDKQKQARTKVLEHHFAALSLEDQNTQLHAIDALGELKADFWAVTSEGKDAPEVIHKLLVEVLLNPDIDIRSRLNSATVLTRSVQSEHILSLLKTVVDRTARTALAVGYARSGGKLDAVVDRLFREDDACIRQALIICLGGFDLDDLPDADLVGKLLTLYEEDPVAGVHGSAFWLLKRAKRAGVLGKHYKEQWEQIDANLAKGDLDGGREWYVTKSHGIPMVKLPCGTYSFGDGLECRTLDRGVAISATPVTVEQFLAFRETFEYDATGSPGCPITDVSWYDAAAYCNWLSEQEELPEDQWCYEPNVSGSYAEGMRIRKNFFDLSGYRLPTEEEWECACRAGGSNIFSFGDAQELLDSFGWYKGNTAPQQKQPVAELMPNEFGLFDMNGNVWEWCQCRHVLNSGDEIDTEGQIVKNNDKRILRGGSFVSEAAHCQSAFRSDEVPIYEDYTIGFRVLKRFA